MKNAMKVLMVTNMYPTAERPFSGSFIKSQIDSIRDEGVDVEIIHIESKKNRLNYIKVWLKIFKKSWDSSFDLIHAHYGYSGMVSRLQFCLPVLVSYCGGDVLGNPNPQGKMRFMSKVFLPLGWILSMVVSAAIVKSEEMKNRLPKNPSIFVVPNGVNFTHFKPMQQSEAKKQVGFKKNKKYVLFPANPNWIRKCYPVARDAVELLRRREMDVELVVLHSLSQDMVPVYMNACDALVLTSLWEGSPNVLKEAMACNLPVVSVDVGDARKVINGCDGCYIARRNAEDVAKKLDKVLKRSERTNGRECIRHLEVQNVARRIIRLYRNIMRSKDAGNE